MGSSRSASCPFGARLDDAYGGRLPGTAGGPLPPGCLHRSADPGRAMSLPLAPRLESWMAKDHPDSQRLREFIDDTLPRIGPYIEGPRCGLELAVRLSERIPLITGGRDLDNYRFPLVYRLGDGAPGSSRCSGRRNWVTNRPRIRAHAVEDEPPPRSGWTFAGTEGQRRCWLTGLARSRDHESCASSAGCSAGISGDPDHVARRPNELASGTGRQRSMGSAASSGLTPTDNTLTTRASPASGCVGCTTLRSEPNWYPP